MEATAVFLSVLYRCNFTHWPFFTAQVPFWSQSPERKGLFSTRGCETMVNIFNAKFSFHDCYLS